MVACVKVPTASVLSLLLLLLLAGTPTAIRRAYHRNNPNRRTAEATTASSISNGNEHHVISSSTITNSSHVSEHRRLVNVKIPSSPDGHLVTDPLPLLKDKLTVGRHWAGHLPASDDGTKYFFYWLFEPLAVDDSMPLLIWLNGGPACSSMDGLFLENGPMQWTVDRRSGKFVLQPNPHSWHEAPAYTLYIDQPVGTGLSFTTQKTGYPRNDAQVNVDFYNFLTHFFSFHSDKFVDQSTSLQPVVSRPLFFSGESHAGHYIPSMMRHILHQNDKANALLQIPLAGAAIGNGFFDPVHQYAAAEAAYGHGLLGRAQVHALAQDERQCQKALLQGELPAPDVCFALLDQVVDESFGTDSEYRVSSYDVRVVEKKGQPRRYPLFHEVTECYLGGWPLPNWLAEQGSMDRSIMTHVLPVLHAEAAREAGQRYKECTDPPYDALADQDGQGVVPDIVAVLEHPTKPRLLFFNGMQDLICNHVGNERALEQLPWQGQASWIQARRYAWMGGDSSGAAAGFVKEFDNLSFLKLLNAGHMVPMDLPEISLQMMQIFLQEGGSFADSVQKLSAAAPAIPSSCPACQDASFCPTQDDKCPACLPPDPTRSPPQEDCSLQVSQAKQDALAAIAKQKDDNTANSGAVALAIGMVVLSLAYGVSIMCAQRRAAREHQPLESDHLELRPRYSDDDEGTTTTTTSNGSVI